MSEACSEFIGEFCVRCGKHVDKHPAAPTLRQVGWIDQNEWLHPLTKADPEDGWRPVFMAETAAPEES